MRRSPPKRDGRLAAHTPHLTQLSSQAHAQRLVAEAQRDFDLLGTVVFEAQRYEVDGTRPGKWTPLAVVRRPWPKGSRVVSVTETSSRSSNLICQPEETEVDQAWYQIDTDLQRTLVLVDPDGTRSQILIHERQSLTPARAIASVYLYEAGPGWTREEHQ